jgi:uncharacterized SAM-binding protein YcdF (DUF218 family)
MKNFLEAPRMGVQVRSWRVPATALVTVALAAGWWLLDFPSALSHRLVLDLESTFPRANLEDGRAVTGVIALGGGEARIREAGRLARRYPQLQIVVTGAGERNYVLGVLGRDIAPDRVLVETQARNTYENALRSKATVHPSAGERWLLITSAAHMPRAIATFRGQGFAAEAWPIWDLDAYRPRPASVARHEWFGLAGYWLLGRTSALLPSSIQALERSQVDHRVAATGGKILR